MNLKPIKDQVVVLPDPQPAQIGLIHVPEIVNADNPNYYTMTGRVVALGRTSYTADGEEEQPFDVQVGERVVFNRYAGKQITCEDDGVRYLVMHEHEILGVADDGTDVKPVYMPPTDADITEFKDAAGRPLDPRAA